MMHFSAFYKQTKNRRESATELINEYFEGKPQRCLYASSPRCNEEAVHRIKHTFPVQCCSGACLFIRQEYSETQASCIKRLTF